MFLAVGFPLAAFWWFFVPEQPALDDHGFHTEALREQRKAEDEMFKTFMLILWPSLLLGIAALVTCRIYCSNKSKCTEPS